MSRSRERRIQLRAIHAKPLGRGVQWQFDTVTFSKDLPRSVVTKLLIERAEHGRWELDRLRLRPDGSREVVLRRKIIRQVRTA